MSDFDDLLARLEPVACTVQFNCDLTMAIDDPKRWCVMFLHTNGRWVREWGITGQGALQTLVDKVAPRA